MLDLLMFLGGTLMLFSSVSNMFETSPDFTGKSIPAPFSSSIGMLEAGLLTELTSFAIENPVTKSLLTTGLRTAVGTISQIFPSLGNIEPESLLAGLRADDGLLLDVTSNAIATIGFVNGVNAITGYLRSSNLYRILTLGSSILDYVASSTLNSVGLLIGYQSLYGQNRAKGVFSQLISLIGKNPTIKGVFSNALTTILGPYTGFNSGLGNFNINALITDTVKSYMNDFQGIIEGIQSSAWYKDAEKLFRMLSSKSLYADIKNGALSQYEALSKDIKSSAVYVELNKLLAKLNAFDMKNLFSNDLAGIASGVLKAFSGEYKTLSNYVKKIQDSFENSSIWVFILSKVENFFKGVYNELSSFLSSVANYFKNFEKFMEKYMPSFFKDIFKDFKSKGELFIKGVISSFNFKNNFLESVTNNVMKTFNDLKNLIQYGLKNFNFNTASGYFNSAASFVLGNVGKASIYNDLFKAASHWLL